MELRHLRYFVAVAEELHFRRAAERLHMSQPPLSQQIRALETELGVDLLVRDRRKVELTPAGRVLLDEAREVLAAADRAATRTRAVARGEAGELSVGFVGSAMYGRLPEVLREYRTGLPEVTLRLRELSTADQLDALADGSIDVGICRPSRPQPGLRMETVHREPMLAAVPAGHRLAARDEIALADLEGETWVLLTSRSAPGIRASLTAAVERTPHGTQEVAEIRSVLGLLTAGIGVSLVPASVAATGDRGGVAYRPLAGDTPEVELWVASRDGDPSPLVAAFVSTTRRVLREPPPDMDC